MLIRPGRLFFRLTEDLSIYARGAKALRGLREIPEESRVKTPSARDYCQFLQELHEESRGQPLNANELKAIIMVITSISQEGDKLLLEEKKRGGLLCVPDQDSVLQSSSKCLVNDDNWLRRRAAESINSAIGMCILHPSIPHRVAKALGVLTISEVFLEKSNYSKQNPPQSDSNETEYQQAMQKLLNNRSFLLSLSSLLSMSSAGVRADSQEGAQYTTATIPSPTTATHISGKFAGFELLASQVRSLELRFVKRVPTKLSVAEGIVKPKDVRRIEEETSEDSLFSSTLVVW